MRAQIALNTLLAGHATHISPAHSCTQAGQSLLERVGLGLATAATIAATSLSLQVRSAMGGRPIPEPQAARESALAWASRSLPPLRLLLCSLRHPLRRA